MTCLKDLAECHYDGSLGYCCSGHCIQFADQSRGFCKETKTTTTVVPEGSNFTTTPFPNCLPEDSHCLLNGSLGTCCSINCMKLESEKFGKCKGSSLPTDIPDKCLDDGKPCKADGSLGFCCSRHCDVIFPHTIGKCKETDIILPTDAVSENVWIIYTTVSIIGVVLAVFALTFIWLYLRQRKLENDILYKEAKRFFKGDPSQQQNPSYYINESVDSIAYNKSLEIKETDFTLDWENRLGQGTYGVVIMGSLYGELDVAVKTVINIDAENQHVYLRALLGEIKILQYVGKHNHIVNILGCHTAKIHQGDVFLFLEYCPLGSLETYLRKNRNSFTVVDVGSNSYVQASDITRAYQNETDPDFITVDDLINWALQITDAMQYLCERKVIHVDLATRNVLLMRKDLAKVTDFGLSRKLYKYRNYVKRSNEPLPWNWMALESLKTFEFSHKSDVWSLGMTFWEMFSFGEIPFECLTWNSDFLEKLENGLRPAKPIAASDKIYQIMLDCWNCAPASRPSFPEIYHRLQEFNLREKLI